MFKTKPTPLYTALAVALGIGLSGCNDNDGAVCVAGEACGSFPNTDQLDVVEITAEETRALEFVTGFRTEIGTAVDELTPDD